MAPCFMISLHKNSETRRDQMNCENYFPVRHAGIRTPNSNADFTITALEGFISAQLRCLFLDMLYGSMESVTKTFKINQRKTTFNNHIEGENIRAKECFTSSRL